MRAPSSIANPPERAGLPAPERLAAVATVLCVYPPRHRDALDGWLQAVSAERMTRLDGESSCEALMFRNAAGRICWRLYLLPDSDFLAWDRLVSAFPARPEPANDGGVAERLWRRLATRLGGEPWRMCALRLHARNGQALAASVASLSVLGATAARRIARVEGADGELWVDESNVVPLVHLSSTRPS